MVSTTTTEVLIVKTSAWLDDFSRNDLSRTPVRDYAVAFYTYMMEPDAIVSDLTYGIDYHGLMFAMPLHSRVVLSEALFGTLDSTRASLYSHESATDMQSFPFLKTRITRIQTQKLRDEVSTGKTCVGVVDQQLARFVFVVAMRIFKRPNLDFEDFNVDIFNMVKNKRFLVQVGSVNHSTSTISSSCVLPGSKRKEQETTVAAMQRCVEEDLSALCTEIEWHPKLGKSHTVSFKDSPTFGLKTMYSRTLFMGFVNDDFVGSSAFTTPGEDFSPKFTNEPPSARFGCLRRSRSSQVEDKQKEVANVLRGIPDVVVSEQQHRSVIYAWVSQGDFEVLEVDEAKPILDQWVEAVASSYVMTT